MGAVDYDRVDEWIGKSISQELGVVTKSREESEQLAEIMSTYAPNAVWFWNDVRKCSCEFLNATERLDPNEYNGDTVSFHRTEDESITYISFSEFMSEVSISQIPVSLLEILST